MLLDGSTLIVKELFGQSVNLDKCLVQTRSLNALTLTIEDQRRN
jgi:hypothetical protein